MRTAVLLLCLVGDNRAMIYQSYLPYMKGYTLEEQINIHQYEIGILKMKLKNQKAFSPQKTNETSTSNKGISQQCKLNTDAGSQESQTIMESLIELQEMLTSDTEASQDRKDPERIFEYAHEIASHLSEKEKQSIRVAFAENKEVNKKNATQLIEEYGYRVEIHKVLTEDGYFITMFRILHKDCDEVSEPVVLLVHGLFGSADDWLLMGPKKSLAYQMTGAGFDVWLGNVRGSKYSQHHTSKHHALPEFWEFSIDEIAAYDLPAMIDYILKITQEDKLYYVGHSLGATAFFAMASAYSEHRKKITTMYALSPMVYMNHIRCPLFRTISPKSCYNKTVHKQLEYGEFKPKKDFMRIISGKMYENFIGNKHVESNLNYIISGVVSASIDTNIMPIIMKLLPGGASVTQIKHYSQAKAAGQLRKYDYGVELNRKVYGQPEPPSYNMSKVHVPVAIYFSEEDMLAHPKDVERLHSELPKVKDYYKIPDQHSSYMEFYFANTGIITVNNRLINSIKETK